ncbi:hypothetical protein GCM10010174_91110 [Kutzneria viridogrisea]|uniref:DUF3558 domain-containing protein n=2 Tax=Kutzneria TaxID=43356 RepID=A0ABR6BX04_9PSEU|nr:DUF3558 family protein [Kutzneria albida]AHH93834.1 putative secreted protein [Kutzneria albida DSM 43870]MBA8931161.1 hypothetical protein [Kutzneria viridogrisea]
MKKYRLAAVLAAGALAVTACGSGAASSSSAPAPSTPARPSSMDNVDPCSLISAQDSGRLGIAGSAHSAFMGGSTSACGWLLPQGYFATIGLFPSVGVNDITFGGTATDTAVNQRQGRRVTGTEAGKCQLYLSAAAHSSAQIEVSKIGGGDTPTACYDALKVAFVIDPKLPLNA